VPSLCARTARKVIRLLDDYVRFCSALTVGGTTDGYGVLDRPGRGPVRGVMTRLGPSGAFDFRSQLRSLVYAPITD